MYFCSYSDQTLGSPEITFNHPISLGEAAMILEGADGGGSSGGGGHQALVTENETESTSAVAEVVLSQLGSHRGEEERQQTTITMLEYPRRDEDRDGGAVATPEEKAGTHS